MKFITIIPLHFWAIALILASAAYVWGLNGFLAAFAVLFIILALA